MANQRLDAKTLIELTFGLLTVKETWRNGKNIMVNCVCQCGKYWVGRYSNLKGRGAKSCWCKAKAGRDAWRKFFINDKTASSFEIF